MLTDFLPQVRAAGLVHAGCSGMSVLQGQHEQGSSNLTLKAPARLLQAALHLNRLEKPRQAKQRTT